MQTMLPCADQAMLWHRGNETSMMDIHVTRFDSETIVVAAVVALLLLLLFLLYAWGGLCRVVFFKKLRLWTVEFPLIDLVTFQIIGTESFPDGTVFSNRCRFWVMPQLSSKLFM